MKLQKMFFFVCLFSCFKLSAQSYSTEISIQNDNDANLFQGSDRYYTDGLFLNYRHALKVAANSKLQNKILGFELGQKIFTPFTGDISDSNYNNDPQYIDRPFAAYLYIGSTLNLLYKDESSLKLGAQIGIVGPGAGGKQVQTFVHSSFGFYKPSGWEYQIDNNYELNLSAEYNRLLARNSWIDLSLATHVNLGNGFTGAGAGPLIRIGSFNKFFNSISTQSRTIQANSFTRRVKREIFFFYKPQFDFIAYDATVQGSLFNAQKINSFEVVKHIEHAVLTNQLGINYCNNRFNVSVAAIFNTKRVKEMIDSEQWGTVTLGYMIR